MQPGEGVECGADSLIDERRESCAVNVVCGYFGVGWVEFEGDDFAVRWKCSGKPYGAVAAEGSDFEDSFRAVDAGEQVEKLALVGGDVNRGKTGARVRLDSFVERVVGMNERVGDIAVYGGPEILIHIVKRIKLLCR